MQAKKIAIVTGSSKGIGKAVAEKLMRENCAVILHGRGENNLRLLHDEYTSNGWECDYVAGDISQPETAQKLVAKALERYGTLDWIVNNAGQNQRSSFLNLNFEDWNRMLDVNLNGCFHLLKAALPQMRDKFGAAVVNISSSAAKTPHPTAAASYGASKGAIDALTRQLALEMAPHGIRVNAVCPGPVETEMSNQWSPEYREQVMKKVPLGRLGKPDDVAELVAFLLSDKAAFITGETININGGTYMD